MVDQPCMVYRARVSSYNQVGFWPKHFFWSGLKSYYYVHLVTWLTTVVFTVKMSQSTDDHHISITPIYWCPFRPTTHPECPIYPMTFIRNAPFVRRHQDDIRHSSWPKDDINMSTVLCTETYLTFIVINPMLRWTFILNDSSIILTFGLYYKILS
jgi:hypothetical protein